MAELIPIQYQLRVAQKRHLAKWLVGGVLILAVSGAGLAFTFGWVRQRAHEHDVLQAQYQEKASLIIKSQEVRERRQELAGRMQQVQQLMDDKTLLSLLRSVSEGFSSNDCLEYLSIDAHAKGKDGKVTSQASADGQYVVRITGITANSTTLADLMTRLGRQTGPAMNVVLESSRREPQLDGQVMRFQILCEKALAKGS